jgi:hypothetical protein
MQRNFDNNDFEQFVKQNADQYRMYPSEKVWKGIHSSLHTRRTWYGLGFVFLILASVVVTWVMVSSPQVKQQTENNNTSSPAINTTQENQPSKNNKATVHELIGSVTSIDDNIFPETSASKNTVIENQGSPILEENEDLKLRQVLVANPVTLNNATHSASPTGTSTTENKDIAQVFRNYNLFDQATDNEYDPTEIRKQSLTGFNQNSIPKHVTYPLTIESVLNSYKSSGKHRKISWQLALTPTISYRRLSENKSFLRNVSFASGNYSYANLYNVNSVVTHKPDMGFEVGLIAGYSLTKNMKIRAGMQFNINRYGIRAFSYSNEVATIALNSNQGKDSLNEVTQYRNFNGYKSDWLQNFYFSVSAPIGIEFNLAGNNKTQFGIAGTIQPTYIISDKAYLISTDYKNYVEVPWLVRRWNMNTGLEMFINYSTGKTKWQVGPQVRYQLLSSFQNKYPVKENLFDFGLKVGIMLNN